jgi:hypothetical protein
VRPTVGFPSICTLAVLVESSLEDARESVRASTRQLRGGS